MGTWLWGPCQGTEGHAQPQVGWTTVQTRDGHRPPATPVFPQLQQPWEPEGAGGLEG